MGKRGMLLDAAQQGSVEALGLLLDSYRPDLLRFVEFELEPMLSSKGDAADLVQETCLDALRGFYDFRGGHREFVHWLRTIAQHNLADFKKRFLSSGNRDIQHERSLDNSSSEHLKEALQLDTPSPDARIERASQVNALNESLKRLPDDYRQVIRLRNEENRSFKEIGEMLNRSAEAVRKVWSRAIQIIKRDLSP